MSTVPHLPPVPKLSQGDNRENVLVNAAKSASAFSVLPINSIRNLKKLPSQASPHTYMSSLEAMKLLPLASSSAKGILDNNSGMGYNPFHATTKVRFL